MFNREKGDTKRVPMMPVRDMVIFPEMMHPFIVGREASVRALEDALAGDKKIFLVTQHDASIDDPKPEEIYQVGTLANIVQSVKLPDGNIKVLVEGTERAKIVQVASEEGFFRATIRTVPVKAEPSPELQQVVAATAPNAAQYTTAILWSVARIGTLSGTRSSGRRQPERSALPLQRYSKQTGNLIFSVQRAGTLAGVIRIVLW